MANSDKNIIITPNTNQSTAIPTITFTGADNTPISLKVADNGNVYFEGTTGEIFEVSSQNTGQLLSLGDSSGLPVFEVSDIGSTSFTNFDVAGKNKIIGGSMEVWQRGTSGLTTWTADRFQVNTGTWQRDTDAPPGFAYSLETITSPLSGWLIQHGQELPRTGYAGDLTGYWTLSFWAKYERGKEFYYASWFADAVGGGNQVAVSNYLNASSPGVFLGTGNWQKYTYTMNITTSPAGTNLCLRHAFLNLTGATTTTMKITGVQFEKGNVATPFSRAGGEYSSEYELCRRYFRRYGANSIPTRIAVGFAVNSTSAIYIIQLDPEMRIGPTISHSGTGLNWYDGSGGGVVTISNSGWKNTETVELIATGSGLTTGRAVGLTCDNATTFIDLYAEIG